MQSVWTTKYVATNTLTRFDWRNTQGLNDEASAGVSTLKQSGDGDIAVLGSGALVRSLMQEDLVDVLRLFIHPLILGSGKKLFGDLSLPRTLRLSRADTTSQGSVALSYDVERP